MCLMCLICLGCRKQTKSELTESATPRPSTTDETEAFIDNMVVPPKRRRSTWLESTSTVFGSVSDTLSPPAACHPVRARSRNYINPRLSSESALYVESYPLCRSDTPTQFHMESCEGSIATGTSKPSGDFCQGRGYHSSNSHYDVPVCYKKSENGDDFDEVFLNTTSVDSSQEKKVAVVTVHIENMDQRKKMEEAENSEEDTTYSELFEDSITPEEKDNLVNVKKVSRTYPDVRAHVGFQATGIPPLPRATLNRLTVWDPADVPQYMNKGSMESQVHVGMKGGEKPRPCSMPHYVNFKGCLYS